MELVAGEVDGSPIELLETIETIAESTGSTVQAFDARYVVSPHHLERALECADRAIERDEAIADDRAVEVLLYAAGRRQIDRAMEMGLKESDHPIVVLIDGGDEAAAVEAIESRLETLVHHPETLQGERTTLCAFFDIGDAELATGATLEALVLERVALLTIDK